MKLRRVVRGSLFAVLLIGVLAAAYVVAVAVDAYIRIPAIVEEASRLERMPLKADDIPKEYIDALITVEDPNFFGHYGVDLSTKGAGWTTITQSLVKDLFYGDFSPGFLRHRKINQTIIALVLDRRVDKRTQLNLFFNRAYCGVGEDGREIIGFQAAANEYFGKDFQTLSRDEFLSLTAMLIAPNDLNVRTHPDKNAAWVARIKRLLNGECVPQTHGDIYYEGCANEE